MNIYKTAMHSDRLRKEADWKENALKRDAGVQLIWNSFSIEVQASDLSKIIASFWDGCQHRPHQKVLKKMIVKNRSQTKNLNRSSAKSLYW